MDSSIGDPLLDYEDISDAGERVTPLYPNDCFYAHLSIYQFAVRYAKNKICTRFLRKKANC